MDLVIGKRVKALRELKGWKQAELATAAGVAANTVSGLERATRETRWPQFMKIAEALGTTAQALMHGPGVTENPLLTKLSDEDLRIAEAFHDARTPIRLHVEELLRHGSAHPMLVWWERFQALDDHRRETVRRALELHEQKVATETKAKSTKVR